MSQRDAGLTQPAWAGDPRRVYPPRVQPFEGSVATITTAMGTVGFPAVTAEYTHICSKRSLTDWLARVRQRHICSQLQTISDADYQAGIDRLQREICDPTPPHTRPDHPWP
jgi:hypothetical protein